MTSEHYERKAAEPGNYYFVNAAGKHNMTRMKITSYDRNFMKLQSTWPKETRKLNVV
jgi:hypothetical protein